MARMKQLAKWSGLALAGLLLLLGLAIGLGYGYLQSDSGRDWAAREIERLTSTPGEVEVRIGSLAGQLPFAVSASNVRIGDGAGAWLTIENVGYEVDPAALLESTLRFRFLEADRVKLDRLPETAGSDETAGAQPVWPTLPLAVWLERVTVGEVALGPAVLGEPASFRVEGEATSQDGSEVDASLSLERIDGEAGSARAALRYVFADATLDLDAQVEEPAGGLIVRALGLDRLPALEARVTGRGPLSDWTGSLALTLEDLAQAKAELRLRGAEDLHFSIVGSIDPATDFDDLPWRLLSGGLDFETEGRWRAPSTLVLEHGRVTSPAVDLALSGSIDLDDETLDAEATAQIADPHILRPYLPNAEATDLRLAADVSGSFEAPEITARATAGTLSVAEFQAQELTAEVKSNGPLSQPQLSVDLRAGRVTAAGISAGDITAAATFTPETGFDWDQPKGKVTTTGTIGELDLSALAAWSPAIGQRLAWELNAQVDPESGQFGAATLSLETDRGRLTGEGSFAWKSGATAASLRLDYADLSPLGAILGLALDGSLEAVAEVTSAGPLGVLDAEIAGTLADLVLPDPVVQALVAPTLDFSGKVGLEETGSLSLTALRLATAAVSVTGDIGLGPDLSALSATYRVEIADLSALSEAVGQPLSGSAILTGRASGSLEALEIAGDLEVPEGSVAAVPVEAMKVAFTASDVPARPSGRLAAAFGSPAGEVKASTDYLIAEDILDLTKLSLAANGLKAEGRAQVPLTGAPLTLGLDGRVDDLSRWLTLAGLDGDGRGTFRLDLSPDGPRQAGRLEARLEDARLDLSPEESLILGQLTATIEGADLLGSPSAKVRFAARDLAVSELDLTTVEIEASGGPAGGDYSVTAAGDWFGELRLDAAGRVAIDGGRIQIEVSQLTGHAFEEDLAMQPAARFVVDGSSIEISDLDVAYGQARLRASVRRAPGHLAADITVENFPVVALRPVIDLPLAGGRGDASLRISGTVEAPSGELTVEVRKARIAELPAFDLNFQGRWADGVLTSSGRLTGLTDEDVVVSLDLPLRLDPETLIPTVPPDRPLAGELVWQGPVGPLWALVRTDLHELSGFADVQVSLAGTTTARRLGGVVELRRGRYESLELGTLLRKLELTADLAENRIQLTRLSATDGAAGSLQASGVIEVTPDQGFSGELEAKFENFAVLRRDDITAIAKGNIEVTGSGHQSLLKGRIETDSIEVHIPDRLPPDVVELAVVEEGAPLPEATANGDRAATPGGHRMSFDLTIDIPRRAFIRGRGIDSEWSGRLKVSGTADKPVIKGKLNLVRGQVTALGKTFQLDQGSVEFLGTASIDPDLNLVARRETDDLDVTISASGSLSNPALAFTSVPELPEDEIVSQVLFGKSTSQLGAIEAAQLAASVAELTGQAGGASGILGRVRSTLGIDVLRLESGETDDSSTPDVAAGKYLSDDVYIGAKQGTEVDSGSAEVEVELTPNISIGSEVGQQGQSEVGIKFKWDY
jgi:translocation and assembly module TamB